MRILTEDATCNLRGDIVIFTLFVIVIFVCMGCFVCMYVIMKFLINKSLRYIDSAIVSFEQSQ